jgi:hypothetical protein
MRCGLDEMMRYRRGSAGHFLQSGFGARIAELRQFKAIFREV